MAQWPSRKRSYSGCLVVSGGIILLLVVAAYFYLVNTAPVGAVILVLIVGAVGVAVLVGASIDLIADSRERERARRAAEFEAQRQRYWASLRTLEDLLRMTPTEFEQFTGELLRSWGYLDVQHTGGGGDLAADLTCVTPDGLYRVVVQCKRYAPGNSVNSPEVQQFIGMLAVHHRAHLGIYVTTSSYTQPALTLGQQHNLRMIDGNQLTTYVQQMRAQVQFAAAPPRMHNS